MLMFCLLHRENHSSEKKGKSNKQVDKQKTVLDGKLASLRCSVAAQKLADAFGVTALLIYPGFTWKL